MRSASMSLIYIRSGSPTIFKAVIAVLWPRQCLPWPKILSNCQRFAMSSPTCRLGVLASLCHSPMLVPLLHPLFLRTRPLPPFGWLLRPIIPSAANQGHDRIVFNFFCTPNYFPFPFSPYGPSLCIAPPLGPLLLHSHLLLVGCGVFRCQPAAV